jgi:hypothetical protein
MARKILGGGADYDRRLSVGGPQGKMGLEMGRTYLFECSRCGFRARVSGRADKGFNLSVQTILCRDCKNLHDAVVRFRIPESSAGEGRKKAPGIRSLSLKRQRGPEAPPPFHAALNRLLFAGVKRLKWVEFNLRCPVSPFHRVQIWNDPDKCPKCGSPLEKHPLPYRIWD